MALTCTPGGPADNSYVTLAQANSYFADTLRGAQWTDHSETLREQALIQATAEIEALGGPRAAQDNATRPLFSGAPYDPDGQALHFPRTVDVDDDGDLYVPESIRVAVIEQAVWLLDQQTNPDILDREELQAQGVRSIGIEGHSETYDPTSKPYGVCVKAWQSMNMYVSSARAGRTRAR